MILWVSRLGNCYVAREPVCSAARKQGGWRKGALVPSIDKKYHDPIRIAVIAAAGIGVPGIFVPALDMGGIGVIWTTMVGAILAKAGRQVSSATVAKIVAAAVSAVSGYVLGSKILTWLAAPLIVAFPVAGVPAVVALNSMLNGIFTLRLGLACARRFDDPSFTAADVLDLAADISSQLVGLPNGDEIQTIKDILAGS
jgi:hypothetical protein